MMRSVGLLFFFFVTSCAPVPIVRVKPTPAPETPIPAEKQGPSAEELSLERRDLLRFDSDLRPTVLDFYPVGEKGFLYLVEERSSDMRTLRQRLVLSRNEEDQHTLLETDGKKEFLVTISNIVENKCGVVVAHRVDRTSAKMFLVLFDVETKQELKRSEIRDTFSGDPVYDVLGRVLGEEPDESFRSRLVSSNEGFQARLRMTSQESFWVLFAAPSNVLKLLHFSKDLEPLAKSLVVPEIKKSSGRRSLSLDLELDSSGGPYALASVSNEELTALSVHHGKEFGFMGATEVPLVISFAADGKFQKFIMVSPEKNDVRIADIALRERNLFAVGSAENGKQIFVGRYVSLGENLEKGWEQTFDLSSKKEEGSAALVLRDGGVIIGGKYNYLDEAERRSPAQPGGFLLSLDAVGKKVKETTFGSEQSDVVRILRYGERGQVFGAAALDRSCALESNGGVRSSALFAVE